MGILIKRGMGGLALLLQYHCNGRMGWAVLRRAHREARDTTGGRYAKVHWFHVLNSNRKSILLSFPTFCLQQSKLVVMGRLAGWGPVVISVITAGAALRQGSGRKGRVV